MRKKVLNYRIIITPDTQTGTGKGGFTAYCPVLGVADDGDTVEEAIKNLQGAMEVYIESLVEDGLEVPVENPEFDIVTIARVAEPTT